MQQLRVLSVNDASEWLLPLREGEQQIQVTALKRLVLEQQQQQQQLAASVPNRASRSRQRLRQEESKSESNDEEDDDRVDDSTSGGGDSYVMFRGRILADMDFFDLNTLTASDFFVFAQEQQEDNVDEDDAREEAAVMEQEHEGKVVERERSRKRKRSGTVETTAGASSVDEEEKAQQLIEMGFGASQVRSVLQQVGYDLASAIAILTGDESAVAMSSAGSSALLDTRELVRKHSELQVLQPALGELQSLSVQQVAASDVFQALMLLKENVGNESLAQLNANPCAAIQFFKLPPQSASSSAPTPRTSRKSSSRQTRTSESAAIDLVDDASEHEERQDANGGDGGGGGVDDSADLEVIARLTSMGFDRDLCVAMYESCGHQEEAALNALCEMLQ